MGESIAFANIIDTETVTLLNEYYKVDSNEISIPSIMKGMIMELELGAKNLCGKKIHNNFVTAYLLTLLHLQTHPKFYDGLSILLSVLEKNQFDALFNWYQDITCKVI